MRALATDARGRMDVDLVTGDEALDALADAGWDELLEEAGCRDPTRRLGVLLIPDPLAPDEEPRTIVVRREGRAVAAAPLAARRERGLVVVRHLGPVVHLFDAEPPALDGEARQALAIALMSQPGDVLTLEELAADGELVRALRRLDPRLERRADSRSFTADLRRPAPGLARRRRQAAQHARRAERGGVALADSYLNDWDAVAPQLDEALELLRRSWDARRPEPYTGSPEGRRMIRATLERLGAEGRVRMSAVEAGGHLAAFHLALVWHPGAVLFKTAYDRELDAVPGLGWRSLLGMLDGLAGEGLRSAGMGTGGDDYKLHAAVPRPVATFRAALSQRGRAYLRLAASGRRFRRRGRGVLAAGRV